MIGRGPRVQISAQLRQRLDVLLVSFTTKNDISHWGTHAWLLLMAPSSVCHPPARDPVPPIAPWNQQWKLGRENNESGETMDRRVWALGIAPRSAYRDIRPEASNMILGVWIFRNRRSSCRALVSNKSALWSLHRSSVQGSGLLESLCQI